ncbi:carboxymuconolactone decarboxylase family protein [Paenibacillus soyae]|uniref:Carboxymuconolactone decarboxylase family protein n=1 Tax=Paenibacillus soyae TaxID=2969249 RepID=A0A9X2MT41_9BACL|nr:carboxymuconolactone decarboxylase family protein [Paenibacillus soyae]MCR2805787.1 carboxymuconolactone decarboxylase family protein [Paenibacillus soyae]
MNYYDSNNLRRIPDLIRLAPEAAQSYLTFEHQVYEELKGIPLRTKELIAIAVSHVTGCPYCIDAHVKKFQSLGGTREEIFEAVLVAACTRAGAVLSHATHSLVAYEEGGPQEQQQSTEAQPKHKPDCFC